MNIDYEKKLEKSKNSDYRLFRGVRVTLVFFPRFSLPNNEKLSLLCKEIRPLMYTQLRRKWFPIFHIPTFQNIPVATKQINVIGFKKQNLLEDEDFDSAFPLIGKSEFDHKLRVKLQLNSYYINSTSFCPQLKLTYAAISPK